jgi:hypothetical protein
MFKRHRVFWVALCIFALLLAKNPFSTRTLIPNFEPYPDTIHYVNSAQSFIRGHGLQIWREGRALKTTVPPLYSLALVPAFLLRNDARMFYFINILLAFGSFSFFYLLLRRLITNNFSLITAVSLFLYVTNYFIYWYPSLAMAENLTLFLFMIGIYLFTIPVSKKNVVIAALTTVAFYVTKYASMPLMIIYFLAYGLKIILRKDIASLMLLVTISASTFLIYSFWEWSAKGSTLLTTIVGFFFSSGNAHVASSDSWFSLSYLPAHLPKYLRAMAGGYSVRFLWDQTPIVPVFVGTPGLLGLFLGMFSKRFRLLFVTLFSLLFSSILFMSTFYSFDMRYLNFAIPALLIGFAVCWDNIHIVMLNLSFNTLRRLTSISLLLIFVFYFVTNAIRLKKQVMLNLKYAETPWYYVSVVKLNKYFSALPKKNRKPVVISSLIPYYIDFFSNNTYDMLPLSLEQEFRNNRGAAWGSNNFSDLLVLYESYIRKGYDVYVHNYGLGNEKKLQNDHNAIHTYFKTILVSTGCYGACNIWRVTLR